MTGVSVWRARGYWALATLLLPLVNPVVLLFGVGVGDEDAQPWLPVLLLIGVANGLLLRVVGGRLWKEPDKRRWRVALGTLLALALSIFYGVLELYAVVLISCPESGCFN